METVSQTKVQFFEYRTFESARRDANDSMSALLVGSRLAAHQLALHGSSKVYLPQIYPDVGRITLLNRTVADARVLLTAAEQHLAYMAIPYVQAVFELLLDSVIQILVDSGKRNPTNAEAKGGIPGRLDYIVNVTDQQFSELNRELLDFVRHVRNSLMHSAGHQPEKAMDAWEHLSESARARWMKITERTLNVDLGQLVVGSGEMVAALAIMKVGARELNGQVASCLASTDWTRIVVSDFAANHPGGLTRRATLARDLSGWRRWYYQGIEVTDEALVKAADIQLLS